MGRPSKYAREHGERDSPRPVDGWRSRAGRAAFWGAATASAVLLCIAWFWYGWVFFEELTETCKALAAGPSGKGLGVLVAGFPVVLIHLVAVILVTLVAAKNHVRRGAGVVLAVIVVVAGSTLGIALNQVIWGGELFSMSAERAECSPYAP